jgi:hypothetical protein
MAMNRHIQQPAQRGDRVAARTGAASLARRQVLLQRRHQEAVATARAVCHRSQLLLAASGSGGNAARVSRLSRWPGSRSKA